MKKMAAIAVMACVVSVSGCANLMGPKKVQQPPFPSDEYAKLDKHGDSVVSGQVFLKTRGGDVKFGAGEEVTITPVTSYSTFSINAIQSNEIPVGVSSEAKAWGHHTQADGNGNFEMDDLPAGDFYVFSKVSWEAPGRFGLSQQGSFLVKRITVEPHSKQKVMLTE